MHEVMKFPKTPQEFINEHTKVVNGERVMPVYRVEQFVSHYIYERIKKEIDEILGGGE